MREMIHFANGGIREDKTGKGMFSVMPPEALMRVAKRYEYGHKKYGASDNYKAGLPASGCFDAAMRHMMSYLSGDNSEDHLAACVWNVLALMHMEMDPSCKEFMDIKSRQGITNFSYTYSEGGDGGSSGQPTSHKRIVKRCSITEEGPGEERL